LDFGLFVPLIKGERIKEGENKVDEKEVDRLIKEQHDKKLEISALKMELETAKRTYLVQFAQLEEEAKGAKAELTHTVQEYKQQTEELRNKVRFLSLLDKQCIATLSEKSGQDQEVLVIRQNSYNVSHMLMVLFFIHKFKIKFSAW